MRLFLSALITALLAPLATQAHSPDSCPALEPAPMRWQLVGFTSASFVGDQGVWGFLVHCQAEFPNSRMCYGQEVVDTVAISAGLTGDAWVRPMPMRAWSNAYDAVEAVSDILDNFENFSCGQWQLSDVGARGVSKCQEPGTSRE
jgi:hypothetical protein